jgi:hypothetical protein
MASGSRKTAGLALLLAIALMRAQVLLLVTVALIGCDERPAGVPAWVLADAEAIDVTAMRDGARCSVGTLTGPEARGKVAKIIGRFPEWPEVAKCESQFCNDLVASWRTGSLVSGEVGLCKDRVTVHLPGPQGCGRIAPPEELERLRQALRPDAIGRVGS